MVVSIYPGTLQIDVEPQFPGRWRREPWHSQKSPEQAVETGGKLGQLARAFDQLPDYEKAQIVAEARARNLL
jgi:hypothetical protein